MFSKYKPFFLSDNTLQPIELDVLTQKKNYAIPIDTIPSQFWKNVANTPKSYILRDGVDDEKKEEATILCFGCHGDDSVIANKVASKIAEIAEKEKVAFIFVAGDNIYPKGASKPNHTNFKKYFEDKFLKYPGLKDKCFFIVLGNHDYNYQSFKGIHQKSGLQIALNEVAHTYLNKKGDFEPEKKEVLNQSELSLDYLMKNGFQWMMPSRFYKIYYPRVDTNFYFLDSNKYLCDYLKLEETKKILDALIIHNHKMRETLKVLELDAKGNEEDIQELKSLLEEIDHNIKEKTEKMAKTQVYWLNQCLKNEKAKYNIIIQHHPFYTVGKRFEDSDARLYLEEKQINALKKLFHLKPDEAKVNYNDLLRIAFEKDGLLQRIHLVIHAHDHATSLYYSEKFCQLNVGGGGGVFQDMRRFKEIKKIPIYAGYGCSAITIKENEILMNSYTIDSKNPSDWHSRGNSFSFSNKTMLPQFDWNSFKEIEDKHFYLKVRTLLMKACYNYFYSYERFKKDKNMFIQSVSGRLGMYGIEGRNRALMLMNILNNARPISVAHLITEVCEILKGSTILLEKINHTFKNVEFHFKEDAFTSKSFYDFLNRLQAILSIKNALIDDNGELDTWDIIEELEACPMFSCPS